MRTACTARARCFNSRLFRAALSELLGTFLLVSLGLSAAATAAVSTEQAGAAASAQVGSGLALLVSLYVTMGVSGGHLNPAVSTALFAVRRMPLVDYAVYQAAQYAGGLVASALVCCFLYPPLFDYVESDTGRTLSDENGTATSTEEMMTSVFVAHGHQSVSVWQALASEVYATGAFILAVRAITDRRNVGPPACLQPPMVAASVIALIRCTSPVSGCALNPARDLPPRVLLSAFLTTGASDLFTLGGHSSFLVPLLGPYLGAAVGSWIYDLCIGRSLSQHQGGSDDDQDNSHRDEALLSDGDAKRSTKGSGGRRGVAASYTENTGESSTNLTLLGSTTRKSRDVSVSVSNA